MVEMQNFLINKHNLEINNPQIKKFNDSHRYIVHLTSDALKSKLNSISSFNWSSIPEGIAFPLARLGYISFSSLLNAVCQLSFV